MRRGGNERRGREGGMREDGEKKRKAGRGEREEEGIRGGERRECEEGKGGY